MGHIEQVMDRRDADAVDEDYERLRKAATRVLLDYFSGKDNSEDANQRSARAQAVLASVTRHEQTSNAREQTRFAMAVRLAHDQAQLEDYIRATLPASPLARVLPLPQSA